MRNSANVYLNLLSAAITAVASQAQTFTTLANFDAATGSGSSASLVQGFDGNFYGATLFGGVNGLGTVFKITPAGVITVLHTFDGADGHYPSGLTLAPDGTFFGTTEGGGPKNNGSVYQITPTGSFSITTVQISRKPYRRLLKTQIVTQPERPSRPGRFALPSTCHAV